jgi:RNA polymerase sigma-70 factor (ECF subfamily)
LTIFYLGKENSTTSNRKLFWQSPANIVLNMTTKAINWDAAIETHRPWLRKVLRCRVGDVHAVEDLMQEVALAVFRQANNDNQKTEDRKATVPSDPNKVAPWLYQLAVRQAANFHRRAKRKTEPEMVAEVIVAANDLQPLDWLLKEEKTVSVCQAMEELDAESREILMLKYTESWSYRQLSDRLGLTEKAVEHRLAKARKQMRNKLLRRALDE